MEASSERQTPSCTRQELALLYDARELTKERRSHMMAAYPNFIDWLDTYKVQSVQYVTL